MGNKYRRKTEAWDSVGSVPLELLHEIAKTRRKNIVLVLVMLGIPPCLLCEWHCSNIRSLPKTRQNTQPANVGLQCTTNHTHEGIDWQQEKEKK